MPNNSPIPNTSIVEVQQLLDFSNEVLIEIGKKFHWKTLIELSAINYRMYQVFTDDMLWKLIFKSYFPKNDEIKEHYKQAFLQAYKEQVKLELNCRHLDQWCYQGPLTTLSPAFKDDDYFMQIAISVHPMALEFGSDRIKNSEYHVDLAISKNALALRHAGEIPKNNRNLATKALLKNHCAARYIGKQLKNSRESLIFLLKNKCQLNDLGDEVSDDKELVLITVRYSSKQFKNASPRLQDDFDVVLAAVENDIDGQNLFYAGPQCRDNKIIAITAIKANPLASQFISRRLSKDPEIIALYKIKKNDQRIAQCNKYLDELTNPLNSNHFFSAIEHSFSAAEAATESSESNSKHSMPR